MRALPRSAFTTVALLAGLGMPAGGALAQSQPAQSASPVVLPPVYGGISIKKGSGELVKLPRAVANIFAADPDVVEVRPASPNTMFVFGKAPGATTIVATDNDGNTIAQYSVTVNASAYAASRIASQSQAIAPGSDVTAETEANGTILHGTVNTAEQANDIVNQAKLIAPGTVINDLEVQEPVQVELKVRIAQMSRTVTRELGIDWGSVGSTAISIGKFSLTGSTASAPPTVNGTSPGGVNVEFPGGNFEGVIDALAADNLAHVLAEPTLTTLSGTQASFEVGGQFPIPVAAQNDVVTVEFKNYGILLTFTPTVFSDGRIALQVAPEYSAISSANAAVLSQTGSSVSLVVPSLTVTSASTTVILGSGQGMAIAGLLSDTTNETDNGVPGLSEMPLLGALFRGDSFQRAQQELVITVTPYIVQPVNNPGMLASPDDGWTPPNDLQRILMLRDNGTDTAPSSIPGDAGFMVQ